MGQLRGRPRLDSLPICAAANGVVEISQTTIMTWMAGTECRPLGGMTFAIINDLLSSL
jgi:hypothetical protein